MSAPTLSKVNSCSVADCVYNDSNSCHAMAITVEKPSAATCGTYTPRAQAKDSQAASAQVANVGACKAADCTHNKDLSCTAASVSVGFEGNQVRCLTYNKGA